MKIKYLLLAIFLVARLAPNTDSGAIHWKPSFSHLPCKLTGALQHSTRAAYYLFRGL